MTAAATTRTIAQLEDERAHLDALLLDCPCEERRLRLLARLERVDGELQVLLWRELVWP